MKRFSQGRWRSRAIRRIGCGVAGLLFFVMFFKWFEHKQVYHPTGGHAISLEEINDRGETVWLQTEDQVRLHAWFLPTATTIITTAAKSPLVILSHGNGGNISHRESFYGLFQQSGLDVLAYDYRGYGKSEGVPSENGTYLDGLSAWNWAIQRGYDSKHIIAWGESLGGAIAAELAWKQNIGALVLQSTFTSIPDIGKELFPWLPVTWLGSIQYDTRSKLSHIQCPVFILHSREDSLIPIHHAENNFAAATGSPQWIELSGDHNDPPHWNAEGFLDAMQRVRAIVTESTQEE